MTEDELIDRAEVLPDQYAERVPSDALRRLRLFRSGGEYGELVSELIATLAKTDATVTPAERDELTTLADATGEGHEWLGQLTVQA